MERFVCGVSRSRSFLSILPFRPSSSTHHQQHFANFAINGSHQGLSLPSLNILFYLWLIFVIVLVVAHYVANRTQIDWRWVPPYFHTIFVFILSIQVKRLVNNSQPRQPGRPLRYVSFSPSSPSATTHNFSFPLFFPSRLPPEESRSPTGSVLVPSLSVRSGVTRNLLSSLSASFPSRG